MCSEPAAAQTNAFEFHGAPQKRIDEAFRELVRLAKLEGEIVPQTLRSRAITWGMQRGMDLWQASSYFGVSTQVLHEVYGHHHPDHLRSAADVMSRPRRPRVRQMRVCNQRLEVAFEHNLVGNPVGGPAKTKPRRPETPGFEWSE